MYQGWRGRHAYGSLVVGGAVVFCGGMRTMFTYCVIFVHLVVFLLPIPQTTSLAVSPISPIRLVGGRQAYHLASGRVAAGVHAREEASQAGIVEITNPQRWFNEG